MMAGLKMRLNRLITKRPHHPLSPKHAEAVKRAALACYTEAELLDRIYNDPKAAMKFCVDG